MNRTLHSLDETLLHQSSRPFRYAATSDHRFYDRHWLAAADPSGETGLIAGIAFYKNMGVCDGYVAVRVGDAQHNSRFARALPSDLERTTVGDLEVTVEVPFHRLRLRASGATTPIAADLTYSATFEPYCEAHYVDDRGGRVSQEITRYDQPGRWRGWVDAGDGRIDVEDWWGVRDHSWGVRPGVGGFDRSVADPDALVTATPSAPPEPMLHLVIYAEVEGEFLAIHRREDRHGRVVYVDGECVTEDGRHLPITWVEFTATFHPDSRQYQRVEAHVTIAHERTLTIVATPLGHAWAYRGTGYDGGYDDGRGLGAWRGEVAEHDVYELLPPDGVLLDGRPTPPGHREQFATIEHAGTRTTGYCSVLTRGALPAHGLR